MTRRKKIATTCFAINAFAFLMIGLTFVLKQSFFPFHADVIQTSWADVDPAAQTLYLGMMRTEGAGYLASAVAIGLVVSIAENRQLEPVNSSR